jgi:hypothetical protein
MFKLTAEAIEVRDLGEMLAALCQVAQDAAVAESASRRVESPGLTRDPGAGDEGASRP